MLIAAICQTGKEFMYKSSSAHAVPKTSAAQIIKDLNKIKFKIKENERWHLYEIDKYDPVRNVVEFQKFYYKANTLREKHI